MYYALLVSCLTLLTHPSVITPNRFLLQFAICLLSFYSVARSTQPFSLLSALVPQSISDISISMLDNIPSATCTMCNRQVEFHEVPTDVEGKEGRWLASVSLHAHPQ